MTTKTKRNETEVEPKPVSLAINFNEAFDLINADLGELRVYTSGLGHMFGQADNSRWISAASRKQLLAEILRLFANNHKELAK